MTYFCKKCYTRSERKVREEPAPTPGIVRQHHRCDNCGHERAIFVPGGVEDGIVREELSLGWVRIS
jgi:hypothetical protein